MDLVQAIEALGHHLTKTPKLHGLGKYMPRLIALARCSPAMGPDFPLLLDALREVRNDAAHLGAAARRTTGQAIAVALILEDALAHAGKLKLVEHYMVEGPTCAEGWQTLAMVRRTMLRSQFSILPLRHQDRWVFVTDAALVHYFGNERDARLVETLADAIKSGLATVDAATTTTGTKIDVAYAPAQAPTLLVLDDHGNLRGILTPFDML